MVLSAKRRVKEFVKGNDFLFGVYRRSSSLYDEVFSSDRSSDKKIMRLAGRSEYLRRFASEIHRRFGVHKGEKVRPAEETIFKSQSKSSDAHAESVREQAFSEGIRLPDECMQDLISVCNKLEYVPDGQLSEGTKHRISTENPERPMPGVRIYRSINPHERHALIERIARDPFLVDVATRYLGATPVVQNSVIFWSFPDEDISDEWKPQFGYHYDIDDYKFIKVFFYLVDVGEGTGPHVIIEGSHKDEGAFKSFNRRLSDEQVSRRFGSRIKCMTGKAGSGFFEDTICYHRGAEPTEEPRLLFQIEYALNSY